MSGWMEHWEQHAWLLLTGMTAGGAGATAQPEPCPRSAVMGFFLAGRGFLACLAAFQVSVVACAPIHPVVCPPAGARNRRAQTAAPWGTSGVFCVMNSTTQSEIWSVSLPGCQL